MILFIKFLLAHLIGDFVLQPGSWVREKEAKKYRSGKLYLHILTHLVLLAIITWDLHQWPAIVTIALSHLFIDIAKLENQNEHNKRMWFFIDQFLHILAITIVVLIVYHNVIEISPLLVAQSIIIITAVVLLLSPASTSIKIILSKWEPSTEIRSDKIETPSLLNAGKIIGYLERILVFIFILYSQWGAIGFLVTAKSVFRFSDLKQGQDRKLTEYILIGTLLSFSIAIVTGLIVGALLQSASVNFN